MSDILFKLLDEENPDHVCLFNRFKNRLFKDYAQGKKHIKKNELWMPLNEITKELYGSKLDKEGFNIIYSGIDINNKGFITKKQFNVIAKCLIMSLIAYFEKKYPIPGREISLCLEDSELPVQMEIIDTLSEEEIRQIKIKSKQLLAKNKKLKNEKNNKKIVDKVIIDNSKINNNDKLKDLLIEIDEDDIF